MNKPIIGKQTKIRVFVNGALQDTIWIESHDWSPECEIMKWKMLGNLRHRPDLRHDGWKGTISTNANAKRVVDLYLAQVAHRDNRELFDDISISTTEQYEDGTEATYILNKNLVFKIDNKAGGMDEAVKRGIEYECEECTPL